MHEPQLVPALSFAPISAAERAPAAMVSQIVVRPTPKQAQTTGPAHDAGDWSVVKELFAAETLTDAQRRMLLSGRASDGVRSAGAVVCACFGVGRTTICNAIAAGAQTPAEIGRRLKAGTNCGSCVPELKQLIAEAGGAAEPRKLVAAN